MNYNKNPLTPHIQVYKWHITSLLSITHRIVGIINFLLIYLICIWVMIFSTGIIDYETISLFLKSPIGKFFMISICWTFSFHTLNEIRHFFWDLGYGYDLKISNIVGAFIFFGSIILTIIIYVIGRNYI